MPSAKCRVPSAECRLRSDASVDEALLKMLKTLPLRSAWLPRVVTMRCSLLLARRGYQSDAKLKNAGEAAT